MRTSTVVEFAPNRFPEQLVNSRSWLATKRNCQIGRLQSRTYRLHLFPELALQPGIQLGEQPHQYVRTELDLLLGQIVQQLFPQRIGDGEHLGQNVFAA